MEFAEFMSALGGDHARKALKPAEPVAATTSYSWRVPKVSTLAARWRNGELERHVCSPQFTAFGVPWHVDITRPGGNNHDAKTAVTEFGVFLVREDRWDAKEVRFNWSVFAGPDKARRELVCLREFDLLPDRPRDNWGQNGFEIAHAVAERDQDDAWPITVVLQRVDLKPPEPGLTLAVRLATARNDRDTHDLRILCAKPKSATKPKVTDAKTDTKIPITTTPIATTVVPNHSTTANEKIAPLVATTTVAANDDKGDEPQVCAPN
jgi:hypothetical protein